MTTLEPARQIAAADIERAVNGPGRRATRLPRPFTIVATGGMHGVMSVASTLADLGYRLPSFSVDVCEGVSATSVTCTVALTTDECDAFTDVVRDLPAVQSVSPW